MMIPEYSPRGTSVTYSNATAVPPMVYRLSLKPASPSTATSPTASAATPAASPTATAVVYVQSCSSRRPITSSSSSGALVASSGRRRGRRHKSYSESALRLERMMAPAAPSSGAARARPYSAGDEVDLVRTVTISGYSKNSHGTWMFKVDVGGPSDTNAYAVRRRFTDFKLLHEGLSELSELPELPPHGIVSVFQLFVSPDKMLTARAARLQELLLVIHAHPRLCKSAAFSKFIGKNPSSYDAGYVSLSGYEVPKSDRQLRLSPAGSFDTSYSV
ncbi:Phox homologous domain [Phytophthora cinnamomi]|uniref:Phox homologous domain n=1 Tax=Phytophthora cinnamomi TaxID=4785 RepID=UPI00355937EA|nr:Phox homologous domain [Phytophthora cinnamomi]